MSMIKEAVAQMKQVGEENIRKVPTSEGKIDIQIQKGGHWLTVLKNLNPAIADDVIRQASNRVILG